MIQHRITEFLDAKLVGMGGQSTSMFYRSGHVSTKREQLKVTSSQLLDVLQKIEESKPLGFEDKVILQRSIKELGAEVHRQQSEASTKKNNPTPREEVIANMRRAKFRREFVNENPDAVDSLDLGNGMRFYATYDHEVPEGVSPLSAAEKRQAVINERKGRKANAAYLEHLAGESVALQSLLIDVCKNTGVETRAKTR